MISLLKAKKNVFFKIEGISNNAPLRIKRRLLELGFTSGTKVRVLRKSLIGQAYLVELRGFTLSMRKDILAYLNVDG